MRHSLDNPGTRGALTPYQTKQLTQARLQDTLNEFNEGNLPKVQAAFNAILESSPKAAIELYLEFLKFSVAQKKAVEVQVETPHIPGDLRGASMAQLEAIAASVVSTQ